jgi:hypothetical protein
MSPRIVEERASRAHAALAAPGLQRWRVRLTGGAVLRPPNRAGARSADAAGLDVSRLAPELEHLFRRAGFGVSAADTGTFAAFSTSDAVSYLVDYEGRPDDVDARIGRPDHAQVGTSGLFAPDLDIDDARQRWLFRMIHGRRPLQERMAFFWHNHFATGYDKVAIDSGALQAAKMMAHKPGTLRGPGGQIELFRQYALGNFRDLLVRVAQDAAMLIWLDGQDNVKATPQENFGREVMELFTLGIGHYTEADVRAASRAFTGWNLRESVGYRRDDPNAYKEFVFNADEHDTAAKTFTFAVTTGGGRTLPARSGAAGLQDGLDLLTALATHPETARRLARKLWSFFISEVQPADGAFLDEIAALYLRSGTEMRPVVRAVLTSRWFTDPAIRFTRYASPPEFVVRAIREVGWQDLELARVVGALANMGMRLYDPPNVGGWTSGQGWLSTATMMARSTFAAVLASSQRGPLVTALGAAGTSTPDGALAALRDRVTTAPLDARPQQALERYATGGDWSGERDARVAGLVRLLVASSEYQLV